jgi:hypothetical protein
MEHSMLVVFSACKIAFQPRFADSAPRLDVRVGSGGLLNRGQLLDGNRKLS